MPRNISASIAAQFQTPVPVAQNALVKEIPVIGAAVSSLLFSGLSGLEDGGYTLELNLVLPLTCAVGLQINGDATAGSYVSQLTNNNSSTVSTQVYTPTTAILFGSTGTTAYASIDINIVNGAVTFISASRVYSGTERLLFTGNKYNATVADITSLVVQGYTDATNNTLANCFGVGTVARLYRKKVSPTITLTAKNLNNVVEKKTIPADTNTVTFSGLDSLADGDYFLSGSMPPSAAATADIDVAINGDTTASNYFIQGLVSANGNTQSGYGGNYRGVVNKVSNCAAMFEAKFSVINSKVYVQSHSFRGNVSGDLTNMAVDNRGLVYTPATASIMSITLTSSTSAIKAGSVLTLYKSNGAQNLVPYSPTDLTSRTSDYPLKAGEVVYKNYSGATSVPLNIATQEGEYEVTILGANGTNYTAGDVYLTPNNAQYAGQFEYVVAYADNGSPVIGGNVIYGYFRLGGALLLRGDLRVATFTDGKSISTKALCKESSTLRTVRNGDVLWNNLATVWASLGTITFPSAQSGRIIIKRIL